MTISKVERLLSLLLEEKGQNIVSAAPDTIVRDAARKMTENKVGSLLVMRGDKLEGIVTERDILNKVVTGGLDPEKAQVHEIMTKDVVVITSNRTVRDAMKIVTEKKLRHLPILKDGQLIGMLSGGDLTRSIVAEEEDVIETLYEYIRGSYPG